MIATDFQEFLADGFDNYTEPRILKILRKSEVPMTRKEIVLKSGMPQNTVYDALVRLQDKGMIETIYIYRKHVNGRPPLKYRIKEMEDEKKNE